MNIKVILFDLGGVLIKLDDFPIKQQWLDQKTPTQLYESWLDYPVARQYECGQISEDTFARRVVDEIPLKADPQAFIQLFRAWPLALFPGVLPMLFELSKNHTIACLSNTNESHWSRVMTEMQLSKTFHHEFASFQLGMVKPDTDIYLHAIARLKVRPEEILFMDDNQSNIATALKLGITAVRTQGIEEVKAVLKDSLS